MVLADYFALMLVRGEGVFHKGMSLLVTKTKIDLAGKPYFPCLATEKAIKVIWKVYTGNHGVFMDQGKVSTYFEW